MFESVNRLLSINHKDITFRRVFFAVIRRISSIPSKVYYRWAFGFPKENRNKLESVNNRHKGERCFIIANGPSLSKIDFSLLKNEVTIGMNRIYLMKDQNGFMPTYLACIDVERIIKPFHSDLDELNIECFFPFSQRHFFSRKKNQYFIPESFSPRFQTDATKPFGNGKTVAYNAIQLAFCMGFSEVYIIGKDHSFNTSEKAGKSIEVKDQDENHFIKNYFLPGQKWDAPDFETEEYVYRLSREAFEKAGRIVKNATIGGKLEVFERVDFYSLFSNTGR